MTRYTAVVGIVLAGLRALSADCQRTVSPHSRLMSDGASAAEYSSRATTQFAKVLSDSVSDLQVRFEAYLARANPQLERARPNFDVTHAFKTNGVWELPFGAGHRLNMADSGMSKLISGWSISGNLVWQSGGHFRFYPVAAPLTGPAGRAERIPRIVF